MPDMKLDAGDAAELAEMLQFLSSWLACDPGRLAPPRKTSPAIPPTGSHNCGDLDSFVFLLGGSDSEPLFGLLPS